MNTMALIMAICEAILFGNILFVSIISNAISLTLSLMKGEAIYYEAKVIALELRSLSTMSILRYLPSIELITTYITHWREIINKAWVNFTLLFNKKGRETRKNKFDILFSIPVYIVETVAPFFAFFSIIVKVKQLGFVVDGEDLTEWDFDSWITFIVCYKK